MHPAPGVLRFAWRLIRSPDAAWTDIAAHPAGLRDIALRYVLPLSLVPAIAWTIGTALFPDDIGGAAVARDAAGLALNGLWTLLGSLLTVAVLATAMALVCPMYGRRRDWAQAFRVAAYGLTPVWVAGVLLVKPVLVLVIVVAALHACLLLHGGARALLRIKAAEAAEYVAVSVFLTAVGSTLLGGVLSFFHIL
jgi:hypothetical protein